MNTARFMPIGVLCWIALACSSGEGAESSARGTVAPAELAQELSAVRAGRTTLFKDQAELDAALVQLSQRFVSDSAVRDSLQRAFPTAFEYVGAEDLYVLSELGEVSVAGTAVLSVGRLLEHVKQTEELAPEARESELGQAQQALILNPVPPATKTISTGLFTIRGESKCIQKFSGDDGLGNLVRCTGKTTASGPWWSPSSGIMDHISVRVVEVGGTSGNVADEGWKSYPCPLVKCAVPQPTVRREARRAFDHSQTAAQTLDEYRKCHSGCSSDASIITFHAVDHGGMTFRFQTSTIVPQSWAIDIDWSGYGQDYEVPWVYNGASCGGASDGWVACRGTGCAPCKELVDAYPRYFTNHPNCVRNTTCDGQFYPCSTHCPAPTAADL